MGYPFGLEPRQKRLLEGRAGVEPVSASIQADVDEEDHGLAPRRILEPNEAEAVKNRGSTPSLVMINPGMVPVRRTLVAGRSCVVRYTRFHSLRRCRFSG